MSGKVLEFKKPTNKVKDKPEELEEIKETEYLTLEELGKRYKANLERIKKERELANKRVTRSYNLKD